MSRQACHRYLPWSWIVCLALGCASPYRSDQGALFGGVTGAGLGALVGEATHHPLAGAAIGAGVGALSGAAVGGSLDQIEANNRAEIAARLGRPAPGAVTVQDVVAMTRSGVPEGVIATHVRNNGVAAPLQAQDIIFMQQQAVSPTVIQTMQTPPYPAGAPGVAYPPPPPVMVGGYYGPGPYWGPPPYGYYWGYRRRW
jgi:hypothetical protein